MAWSSWLGLLVTPPRAGFCPAAPISAAERVCQQAVELLARTGYDDEVLPPRRYLPDPLEPLPQVQLPAQPIAAAQVRAELEGLMRQFNPAIETGDPEGNSLLNRTL